MCMYLYMRTHYILYVKYAYGRCLPRHPHFQKHRWNRGGWGTEGQKHRITGKQERGTPGTSHHMSTREQGIWKTGTSEF